MKHLLFTIIYIVVNCLYLLHAQTETENKIYNFGNNINEFSHLYPQEKVYLHFDNTGYFLNETIWFKAYVTQASDHIPTPHSKVLYTELVSPEGIIIETKKYKLENGKANGDFRLPDTLFAGFYEVRAYTKAMLNWDKAVIFNRVFPIFDNPESIGNYSEKSMTIRDHNRKVPETREKEPKLKNINIGLYPEGGSLIEGIINRVAFKITDINGKNIDLEGSIRDSIGNEITKFKTIHNGMGSFEIVPDRKNMNIILPYNNKNYSFRLPKCIDYGYLLRVNNLAENDIFIQIEKHKNDPGGIIGLSVSCRGIISVIQTIEMNDKNSYSIRIPKRNLPDGVNQITVFDENGNIFCERLFLYILIMKSN